MRFSVFYPMADYTDAPDIADLYEQALRFVERAEALGYAGFYWNEGHVFRHNFRLANPRLLIAAAAQRSRRLQLGTALTLLTYHDPRMIAEDVAILDALLGDRFVFGAGPGFQADEISQFGIAQDQRRAIFDEKLAVLEALLRGETVTAQGAGFACEQAHLGARVRSDIWTRCYRGTVSIEGAAAIGESGWGMMCSPLERRKEFANRDGVAFVRDCVAAHRLGWMKSSRRDTPCPPSMMQVYCAVEETADELRARAADAFERFQLEVCRREPFGAHHYFNEYAANEASMIGPIEEVKQRIAKLAETGVSEIMLMFNFGGLSEQSVLRSMELFASEIAPAFTEDAAPVPTAKAG